MEYHSFLSTLGMKNILSLIIIEFPSPYGVIFILTELTQCYQDKQFLISFRLLTEYHSFLCETTVLFKTTNYKFPSPYGVSFILINNIVKKIQSTDQKFPSPCGVIFILTNGYQNFMICAEYIKFPSPYGVIFILTYCDSSCYQNKI